MATKVTILGEEQPKNKKIQFCLIQRTQDAKSTSDMVFTQKERTDSETYEWDSITLLMREYKFGYDLMFARGINGDMSKRAIILGHFNDGIV